MQCVVKACAQKSANNAHQATQQQPFQKMQQVDTYTFYLFFHSNPYFP